MDMIERVDVGTARLNAWGIQAHDYKMDGRQVDFQDLLVNVSKRRAVTVEGEIAPLSTRIKSRNKELEILGSLLAIFTQTQAKYASDAAGDAMASVEGVKAEMVPLGSEAYRKKGGTPRSDLSWWNSDWSKASVEGMISILKNMIDGRNNQSQTDMTRLQSLVDRRDQAFSSATELMTNVSDTRGNLIANIG